MKIICSLILLISAISIAQNDPQPEVFLPQFFDKFPNVRDLTISNDHTEMYFTVESFKKEFSFIAFSSYRNGEWSEPKIAPFSGKDKDLEPFLSPDNLKLYFASNRNTSTTKNKTDFDIWYVERKSLTSDWQSPVNIGPPINTDNDEFYPAITNSGNLYFTATISNDTKGKEDIYMSIWNSGTYEQPISLSKAINSETYEFNAYVSPNEDLIVYSSYRRDDSFGSTDLYMSTKDADGNWNAAKNMGKSINSSKTEYCPYYDITSNTFYFTSDRSAIPSKLDHRSELDDLLIFLNSAPNGTSRIFSIELPESLFQ